MKRSTLFIFIALSFFIGVYWMFYKLTLAFSFGIIIAFLLLVNISAFLIMSSKKMNESKLSWILVILYLPVVGLFLYWMFGVNSWNRKRFEKKKELDKKLCENEVTQSSFPVLFKNKIEHQMDFLHLIDKMTSTPLFFKTKSEILTNGDEKFPKLFEVLKEAERFIHMEYFIIHEGELATELKSILIERAMSGIEVRILYDDFGCVDLSSRFINELKEAGVLIHPFNPVTLQITNDPFNYRRVVCSAT